MEQLHAPSLGTVGAIGMCLAFGESAYGAPHLYPYAYKAWEAVEYKHEDQNFPADCDVPIWFSYVLNGEDLGHVAIRLKDGRILSSPWQHGTTQAILSSIDELIRIYSDNGRYPMRYLGWSEDIAGLRVVKPVAPPSPYTITPIAPKQVRLNKQPTKEWNLALANFEEVASNPFTSGNQGDIKTVVAELKHHGAGLQQYTYYLENASNPVGWNTLDCDDYTPPAPAAPYVPPQGAVQPAKAEKYELVTALPYYASADDCQNNRNPVGMLQEATYYVWKKAGNNSIYYDLSTSNTSDQNAWVNILNNKVKPVVAPLFNAAAKTLAPAAPPSMSESEIRATYRDIHGGPIDVTTNKTIMVADILGRGKPITVQANGKPFRIYGTFRKNNQWYARPMVQMTDKNADVYFYGVPIANSNTLDPFLNDVFGLPEQLREGYATFTSRLRKSIDGILGKI